MQIENKVFLVTGGASGLGAATAEMLVAAGAKVMLVDMNADAVAAQAERLGAQSVVADISNEAAAEAAVQTEGRRRDGHGNEPSRPGRGSPRVHDARRRRVGRSTRARSPDSPPCRRADAGECRVCGQLTVALTDDPTVSAGPAGELAIGGFASRDRLCSR